MSTKAIARVLALSPHGRPLLHLHFAMALIVSLELGGKSMYMNTGSYSKLDMHLRDVVLSSG